MYLCIDVGGTKTLVAVFNNTGKPVEQLRFETPKDYPDFIEELAKTIKQLKTKDFLSACIAIPGKVDRINGIGLHFGNLDWLNIPIQKDIEQIINAPVWIENDANLAGLSEATLLIKQCKKVLYLTISTGIGSVFVVNGTIDKNTEDSEVGHMLLEHNGKLMRWQEFASGKAIFSKFGERASDITSQTAWYVIARNIAIGLVDLIATYTPDCIVIGGGVGSHLDKFIDKLESELKIYETPILSMPKIIAAKRPEEAVVYGCFRLIKQKEATL